MSLLQLVSSFQHRNYYFEELVGYTVYDGPDEPVGKRNISISPSRQELQRTQDITISDGNKHTAETPKLQRHL